MKVIFLKVYLGDSRERKRGIYLERFWLLRCRPSPMGCPVCPRSLVQFTNTKYIKMDKMSFCMHGADYFPTLLQVQGRNKTHRDQTAVKLHTVCP